MSTFRLTLDTTPPKGSITAPAWTRRVEVPVVAEYNEILDDWQICYIFDSEGIKHSFDMTNEGNVLTGSVSFARASLGNAIIHVETRDEVHNERILERAIVVSGHYSPMTISSEVSKRALESSVQERQVLTSNDSREVKGEIQSRGLDSSAQTRGIDSDVEVDA